MRATLTSMKARLDWGGRIHSLDLDPAGSVALFWSDQSVTQILGGFYARHPRRLSEAERREHLGAVDQGLFSEAEGAYVDQPVIEALWSRHRAPAGYLVPWIWKTGTCPPRVDQHLPLEGGPAAERPRLLTLDLVCELAGEQRQARLDAFACSGLVWDDLGARLLGEFYDAHPRHLSPEEALIHLGAEAPRFFDDPTRLVVTGRVIERLWAHRDEAGHALPWIWKTGACPPMMGATWHAMEPLQVPARML